MSGIFIYSTMEGLERIPYDKQGFIVLALIANVHMWALLFLPHAELAAAFEFVAHPVAWG